ncbi:MAG TPA: hypothetical protein VJV04_00255 [Nitrospiraceae bacterium]|nr:hypothetical protein [Nitrospiraceae bacterium]
MSSALPHLLQEDCQVIAHLRLAIDLKMFSVTINGGDGDQNYFSHALHLKMVKRDWFSGDTPHGFAILFQVVGGLHDGEYIALTSRVQASLDEQFRDRGWASVIVQTVKNAGPGFVPNFDNLRAVGMAFADLDSRV